MGNPVLKLSVYKRMLTVLVGILQRAEIAKQNDETETRRTSTGVEHGVMIFLPYDKLYMLQKLIAEAKLPIPIPPPFVNPVSNPPPLRERPGSND